jgi:electron transfer flavoprotein alpha subunit
LERHYRGYKVNIGGIDKMNWTKRLTKAQMAHLLNDGGVGSLESFKQIRKLQKEMQAKVAGSREVCWDCREIAVKLGLES